MDYSLYVLFIPIQKLLSRLMYQFVVIAPIIAYSIHSHISYILETNSKRPIRKKRTETANKVKWKN